MRDLAAISIENFLHRRVAPAALIVLATCLGSCSDRARLDPVETYTSRVALDGTEPVTLTNALQRGVYLVEAREQDVDARLTVAAEDTRSSLEDRLARHGVVYRVVSLRQAGPLTITVTKVDHPTKRGSVLVRILRWQRDLDAKAGELELGFTAQASANELSAAATTESWAEAADKLHEAVTHFEAAGDEAARAQAAYSLAYVQYGPRDQFEAATRACEIAAEAFGDVDDPVGVQNAQTLRAAAEIELASSMKADTQRAEQGAMFAEADRRLKEAAEFFKSRNLGVRAEYAVNMRAVRAVAVGDYDAAAALLASAVQMARANDDVREHTLTLANLAAVHNYLGEVAQAAAEYEALLPLIDRDKQPYQYAGLVGNYGQIMIVLGDFDRALELHTQALDIYTQLGEEDERAVELSALGGLYFRMGDAQRALETVKLAIVTQERLNDTLGLVATLRLAGNVSSALGQHADALEYLRRSARINANPHGVASTDVLIAAELRATGNLEAAAKVLAVPIASPNRLVLAEALEERARIHLAQRESKSAIEDLRTADAHYAALGLEINRIDTNATLSRILLAERDVRGAIDTADEAIAIVGRIRVKSANPEWRARFLSARYAPYEARIAAELASDHPDVAWRSFQIAEDIRARSLADELAAFGAGTLRTVDPAETALRGRLTSLQLRLEADLQRDGSDERGTQGVRDAMTETRAQLEALRARRGVAAGQSSLPKSLGQVQAALPPDTAVLAYFVGDVDGHAWLLTRDTLRHAALPSRAGLERNILAAQREERGGSANGVAAVELGRALFGHMLDGVRVTKLLLLADGPLNSVSFAALPLPDAGHDLVIDRFAIASAPSLMLALAKPVRDRSRNSRAAVVSDPVYAPDDRRLAIAMHDGGVNFRGPPERSANRLTRLPFSALEAVAVSRAFGANHTIQLSDFDATPTRVLELPSRELAVLHFATHAVAQSDSPDQSALFLTEYARDGTLLRDSRISMDDIARSGLRADVVVLSGCATGDGRALRGEGVLGLTYGFLANGSHSVVASLWPIEDASTARFMNEFYRAYRESGRASDALRTAQLRSRATSPTGVWSSFVVRANEFP